jgi:hypothetical protein
VRRWLGNIKISDAGSLVVLDGQARPKVIQDAAKEMGISAFHVPLMECAHEERRKRLLENLSQPDEDNLDITAWAAYLRGQADALNLEIIDTTGKSVEDSIRELALSIEVFAKQEKLPMDILR